jgi:putative ABC transport system permease protein
MDLLDELNASGVTVVVITHDPAVAARAHRQVTIFDGSLTESAASATSTQPVPVQDQEPNGGSMPPQSSAAPAAPGTTPLAAPLPRQGGGTQRRTPRHTRREVRYPAAQRTQLGLRDALAEALAGVVQRPGRSILTTLGTVLGVGAFVAVLGLTSTATGQVGKSFSLLQDTTVTVQDLGTQGAGGSAGPPAMDFPADSDARLTALNGVVDAGVWWQVPLRNPHISQRPDVTAASAAGVDSGGSGIGLFAASPGALGAMQPTLNTGTLYNAFHQNRGERVCLLGAPAARLLGITRTDNQPAVFVNGVAYAVVGIVSDVQRLPQTLLGLIIPSSTALAVYGPPVDSAAQALIRIRPGAGTLIAHQAPLALRPDKPQILKAAPPPDPHSLRDQVSTDLSGLFLVLAAICLVVGALGIANTTLVAVLERTSEIGLRRALGARPRHITAQFLTESTALGALGGLIGAALGAATVVGTALARDWTAVLQPYAVLPAPLIGMVTGFAAGLYPALRAARTEPLEALRR